MSQPEWKLVESYTVTTHACTLRAGQVVALRRDLVITGADGPTGKVYPRGERWTVLHGAKDDPGTVWFRQADGHRHTWTDSPAIFEWFEVVNPAGDGAG